MIDRFTDRLTEYLDGDIDPRDEALIEAHLVDCATCRATLAELRAVVARAAALPPTEPKSDLWPDIRARIEQEVSVTGGGNAPDPRGMAAMLPGHVSRKPDPRGQIGARRRISFSVPQLAAASIALALASGTAVWMTLNVNRAESGAETAMQTETLVENPAVVRFVGNEQRNTIAALERVLDEQRDSLDPVTVAVLESNLSIIDAAITEAVAALTRDPGNAYLSRHLGNTVEKKIDVLRRAAQVARTEI